MENNKSTMQILRELLKEAEEKTNKLNSEMKNEDLLHINIFTDEERRKLDEMAKMLKEKAENMTFNIQFINCQTFFNNQI